MPRQKARKTGRRTSKNVKSARQIQKKPNPSGKSLLILECDADKLAVQSISMADEIKAVAQLFARKVKIEVVKATTEENLKLQFAHLAESNCRFGIVVVIGHSNRRGLNL